jgi:hypothetical protein
MSTALNRHVKCATVPTSHHSPSGCLGGSVPPSPSTYSISPLLLSAGRPSRAAMTLRQVASVGVLWSQRSTECLKVVRRHPCVHQSDICFELSRTSLAPFIGFLSIGLEVSAPAAFGFIISLHPDLSNYRSFTLCLGPLIAIRPATPTGERRDAFGTRTRVAGS